MRKHYLISAGSFAACFFFIFAVVAMIPSRLGVTKANFDRIQKGMTFADVSSLLGELPGIDNIPAVAKHSFVVWVAGDGATAEISFNNGLVDDCSWRDSTGTIFDNIRRWLSCDGRAVPPPEYLQPFALPSEEEILKALAQDQSVPKNRIKCEWSNFRMESPRFYPNIGQGRVAFATYKFSVTDHQGKEIFGYTEQTKFIPSK